MGYHWRDHSEGATLSFNYRGVGSIQKAGDGYRWTLTWGKRVHEGTTRNPQRQKLWMTRWVAARTRLTVEEILRADSD